MVSPQTTSVVVEYVHNGRRYSIELDTSVVGAIVFGDAWSTFKVIEGERERPVLDELKPGQHGVLSASITKVNGSDGGAKTGASPIATRSLDEEHSGPPMWWWLSGTWIHPQDPPGG